MSFLSKTTSAGVATGGIGTSASSSSSSSSSSITSTSRIADNSKDLDLVGPPSDTPSSLSWAPNGDYLAATSWDKSLRVWQVMYGGQAQPVAMFQHDEPLMCCRWTTDGTKILAAGCDNIVKLHDLNTKQSKQVGSHDAPIRSLVVFNENYFVTGSWDKTIRGWDLRTPKQEFVIDLEDRVYSMDCVRQDVVAVTADRKIKRISLTNIGAGFKSFDPLLRSQIRTIAAFPAGNGYAIGSIDGRISVQYYEKTPETESFSFKCHRDSSTPPNAFHVNQIHFNPRHGTFVSCGGDGGMVIWDKDSKCFIRAMPKAGESLPITCCAFSSGGNMLAYGVGYDWSRGHMLNSPGALVRIRVHFLGESDVKPRPPKKKETTTSRFR